MEILSVGGRDLVAAVIRQTRGLYPPGSAPLKNVVTNYSSLTGSDKWLLASIMLLVFRPVLHDTGSLVKHWMGVRYGRKGGRD